MQKCVAEAVTVADSIIIEKMALKDEENLSKIKREIFKVIKCSNVEFKNSMSQSLGII